MAKRKASRKLSDIDEEEELSKLNESVRELCPKNGMTRMHLWKSSLVPCRIERPPDSKELNNARGKSVSGTITEKGNSTEESQDEKYLDFRVISRRATSLDSSRILRASSSRATRNFDGNGAFVAAAAAESVESFWKVDDGKRGVSEDWKEKTFMRDRGGAEGRKSRERLISGNQWLQKREQMLLSKLSLVDQ